jgi:hypothetical protein
MLLNRRLMVIWIGLIGGGILGAQSAPAWMTDLDSGYPPATYLAADGSGDTRRDAEQDAAGALARLFNVNVKADSQSQQRYLEIVNKGQTMSSSETAIVQNVGMQADEQFTGLKFSEPFTDKKGTVHIVAYLEREATGNLYVAILQKDTALIEKFKARATEESSLLRKYAMFDTAVQVSMNSDRMLGQLRIINLAASKAFNIDTPSLVKLRDEAAKNVTYKLTIDGDDDQKIAGLVKVALSTIKLSSQPNGNLEVKGSWTTEPVVVNPKYKTLHWTLNLSMTDETGAAVASYFKDSRETAISDAEALAFAYKSVQKELAKAFIKSLTSYLDGVAQFK